MIDTASLNEWVIENDIESRAIEYYWKYIKEYINNVEDEYSNTLKYLNLDLMSIKIYKVSFSTIIEFKKNIINVYLDIFYMDNNIGRYEVVFSLSSEHLDEFIDLEDVNYIWRLADVYEKTFEIAKIALEEGAKIDFVSKITGLSIKQITDNIL